MPLILAIDPDKRQSTQLANLVKAQLRAELLQRPTASEALEALKGRVPDLVLTSSLMSPREDAVLATYLRELGTAAAHVQTVTIPLLGTAAPTRAKGVLAALRREKPQAAMTDGCAPDVFAEQIRQYLVTAEEQKAAAATMALEQTEPPAPPSEMPPSELPVSETYVAEAFGDDAPAVEASAAPEPLFVEPALLPEPEPELEPELVVAAVAEPPAVAEITVAAAIEVEPDELVADEPAGMPLSQLLQLVSDEQPRAARTSAPPVAPVELAAEVAAPDPVALIEEPMADELVMDPVAAQALDELSRQAPAASLADGIPDAAPVPVVEMRSFETLDSIASELAAGPPPQFDDLDNLASLFAATPATRGLEPSGAALEAPAAETQEFESLFATPAPAAAAAPIEVPGIDPGLFAAPSAPAPAAVDPIPSLTYEPVHVAASVAEAAHVPALPEPALEEPRPEPVAAVPVYEEPVRAEAVFAEAALPEVVPVEFELLEAEPALASVNAAAGEFDEEIALDVDGFDAPAVPAPAAAAADASDAPFSFTFVENFGDAWSDFEVPGVAAAATGIAAAANAAGPQTAAPILDDEALSMIGDAAHKVGLDALVIEEFERAGRNGVRKAAKPKKAPPAGASHAGATHAAPAAERPAKKKGPVQDEWGLFDPDQAGFAALEEEDAADPRKARDGTRVRVISY